MKVKNNKRSKRFSATLLIGMVCLMVVISASMVSAVWWNPFTWFDSEENVILQKGGKWIQEYSTDEEYKLWIENPKIKKTEICLLHKTVTKLNSLPQHKNLYGKEKETITQMNRKKKTIGKNDYYGFCRKIENEEVKYIKFGEHSTTVKFEEEILEVKDESNNTIAEAILTTDNYYYKNDKPHVDYGLGYGLVHSFRINKSQNYTDIINNIYFKDMNTNEIVIRDFDLKYMTYETSKVPIKGCVKNSTSPINQSVYCSEWGAVDYYNTTVEVWHDLNQSHLNSNNILTIGVFTEKKEGDYIDVGFDFAGVDVGIFWASWSSSLNVDMIFYYKLDEASGTVVEDASGNLDSTNTGAEVGVSGKINTAYDFIDPDKVVSDSNIGLSGTDSRSFSAWLYHDEIGSSNNRVFGTMGNGGSGELWRMQVHKVDSKLQWTCWGGGCDWTTDLVFPDDQWNHVVMTYNGTHARAWLNGVESSTIFAVSTSLTNTAFWIGEDITGEAPGFGGEIDEVGLWSRALTSSEVSDLYNGGSGLPFASATAPTVELGTPANETAYSVNSKSQDFTCKGIDDINLANLTFYLWNSTDSSLEYSSTNTDGDNNTLETFTTTIYGGTNYTWNCYAMNNNSLGAWATTNNTVYVYSIPDNAPKIVLNSPLVETNYTSPQNITFNFTASDDFNLVSVAMMDDSTTLETNSSGINNTDYIFITELTEGDYDLYGKATDNSSQTNSSDHIRIVIEFSEPVITLITPANNSNITSTNPVTFSSTITNTDGIKNVSFYLDGVLNETDTSGTNGSYIFTKYLTEGSHNWSIEAYSIYGKIKTSETNLFNYDSTPPIVNFNSPEGVIINYGTSEGLQQTLQFSISDAFPDTCTLYYNWFTNTSELNSNWIDGNKSTYGDLPFGEYQFSVHHNTTHLKITDENGDFDNVDLTSCSSSDDKYLINISVNGTAIDKEWYNFSCIDGGEIYQFKDPYVGLNAIAEIETINNISCSDTSLDIIALRRENVANITATDDVGNSNYKSTYWNYSIWENELGYSSSTTGGSKENLTMNITYDPSFTGISAILNYNGTNYSMETSDTGNTVDFLEQIIVPSTSSTTNYSFYFIAIPYNSTGTYESYSSTYLQLVNPFKVDNCSNYTDVLYYFELLDEDSQTEINGTIEAQLDFYPLDEDEIIGTYNTSIDYTIGQEAKICLEALNGSYDLTYKFKYYGDNGHFKEYKNAQKTTVSGTNTPQNLTLYDLNESRGYAFNIIVVGNTLSTIGNVGLLVDTQRQYLSEAQFKSVESTVTSSGEIAVSHLIENDVIYNFLISYNGELLGTFNNYKVKCANPTLGQCSITLNLLSATGTQPDFETYGNVTQVFLLDETTNTLYHTFTSTDGNSKTVRSLVLKDDGYGNTTICNGLAVGTSGTIICNIPSSYQNSSIFIQTFVDGGYVGSKFFSQGVDIDWQGADIIILLFMFSSLVLLFIGHPITIVIGALLGLILPALLISAGSASFGSLMYAVIYYVVAGIIVLIVIGRKRF